SLAGWRLELTHGQEHVLVRQLPPASSCEALAEAASLIVERYFREVAARAERVQTRDAAAPSMQMPSAPAGEPHGEVALVRRERVVVSEVDAPSASGSRGTVAPVRPQGVTVSEIAAPSAAVPAPSEHAAGSEGASIAAPSAAVPAPSEHA